MPQKTDDKHRPGPLHPDGSRHTWIDALRLMAGLSMLGLHATADQHGLPFSNASSADRVWPMILRTAFYCARTELFVMLSVFLLMLSLQRRPRTYAQTMRQQARRLMPPFLFWTVFYSLFSLLKAGQHGYFNTAFASLGDPGTWVSHLLLGTAKYHMHFIPTLLVLLLFYPIFRTAYARPWMLFTACLGVWAKWYLERWAYPAFWGTEALPYILRAIKVISYLGYGIAASALAGIWIRNARSIRRHTPWGPVLSLGIVASVLLILKARTTAQVITTGHWVFDDPGGYLADFLMPVVLLLLTMMMARVNWPSHFSKWAPYSLGLYLCHPIFLDLTELALLPQTTPIWQVIFKISLTVPLTVILLHALKNTKHLAWTIGMGPVPEIHFFHATKSTTRASQKEDSSC